MNVGMSVVTSGMKQRDREHRRDQRSVPRKRIFAITRPPLTHSIHWRPTAQTDEDHRVQEAAGLNHLRDSGERLRVVLEVQRARDHLRRLDRELLVRHQRAGDHVEERRREQEPDEPSRRRSGSPERRPAEHHRSVTIEREHGEHDEDPADERDLQHRQRRGVAEHAVAEPVDDRCSR